MVEERTLENGPISADLPKDYSQTAHGMTVWSEYIRAKQEVLDRYYNTNWFMCSFLNKKQQQKKHDSVLLSLWRDNLTRLYWLLEPHEKQLREIVLTEDNLGDLDFLIMLTRTIFNLDNLKSLTTYGMYEKEPIKAYKEENYGMFED